MPQRRFSVSGTDIADTFQCLSERKSRRQPQAAGLEEAESGSVAGTPKPKPEAAERSTKASRQRIPAETFKGGRWPG